jgi:CubicO group peptidase (beta-lactamase class C family)
MDYTVLEARLEVEVNEVVEKNADIFNAVLGVSDARGDFYWTGAAGRAYPEKSDSMTPKTPIFIASVTKMYTAAVTMKLEDEGKLSLDDPISKYLPAKLLEGIHRHKGRDYSEQLRIYHLISQTSGLPDYFTETPKGGKSIFDLIVAGSDEEWGVEDVVRITREDLSPTFPPEPKGDEKSAKKAHYADTNYQLLGAVIESATDRQLGRVFDELIIEPLELSSTYLHGYSGAGNASSEKPANIYYKTNPLYLDKAMTSFGPDGGMVSNVADSLKFLKRFMNGGLFEDPAIVGRMKNWKSIFAPFHYGLGLMRIKIPRIFSPFSALPELVGHSGASSAFLFHSEADQVYIAGTLSRGR